MKTNIKNTAIFLFDQLLIISLDKVQFDLQELFETTINILNAVNRHITSDRSRVTMLSLIHI